MSGIDPDAGTPPSEPTWPPPGLEHLQGALVVPVHRAAIGSLLLALPVLWAVTTRESLAVHGAGLVFLLIATGLVFYLGAILRTAGVIDQSRRALLLGYSRTLIADVAADFDRRAGALALEIEPYASIPADARAQARSLRRRAAVVALAAGLVTPFMLAVALLLAVRGTLPVIAMLAIALGPGVLLALAAAAMRLWTLTLLQWSRSAGAWDPSPVSLQDRADAWRARYAPGEHASRPALLTLVLATIGGIGAFVFVLLLLSIPVLLALRGGAIGAEYAAMASSSSGSARVEVIRPYRLPVDSSIGVLRAGAALHDLAANERPWLASRRLFAYPERVLFTTAYGTGPAALRDSLRDVRAHPADSVVAFLAHAPAADLVGARFGTTPPPSFDYSDLSIDGRSLRGLVKARAARAGFLAAEGRAAEAERVLREVASVAVLLHDEAPTTIDAIRAGSLARGTAEALAALYEHTGRTDQAQQLRRSMNTAERMRRMRQPVTSPGALTRTVRDTTAPAYVRWEALSALVVQQRCGDPRAAVFETDYRARIEELRPQMVQRPSDEIIFDLVTRIPVDNLDRGVPRIVRRALTALMGPPSDTNLCLWGGTFL